MEFQIKYITPDIKLSCYEDELFKTEFTFEYHMLVWFMSGETKIIQANRSYTFSAGDIFLVPRNTPATIINYPKDGQPHKTVVMHLTTTLLQEFYAAHPPVLQQAIPANIRSFPQNPLLHSCLASLLPYFDWQGPFPQEIAHMKLHEAISILRLSDPGIDEVLANFEAPGKIDLVDFMEHNYMFNMPLARFGYLTGRSRSTFIRDFRKHFGTTPQRWLTRKRLELAHYELSQKQKRPADIYLEVGFEDLSHFSFAFKKQFGYAPGTLLV